MLSRSLNIKGLPRCLDVMVVAGVHFSRKARLSSSVYFFLIDLAVFSFKLEKILDEIFVRQLLVRFRLHSCKYVLKKSIACSNVRIQCFFFQINIKKLLHCI